ncbi:surfactin synthase thioesterase subunit [Kitasatospora sp. MAP12-15]|uniref:thioesterase II family protein n=1 Tax=unclassified Kitasatospora TaxID=2633591 RepID=UPI0024754A16|nr:alpha/beta fold hydrolase [Kitasatospora sp. MAP12-44]MDH6108828.1 surfactin synthase thioesterase subunit [Kitasatospora sp. MAP12-44]
MTAIETDQKRWIRRYNPAPDPATTLVCLPHAGGSATFFFPYARALAPTHDVLAVQYPGRQDRRAEPLIDSIDELADQLSELLLDTTAGPVALFGHSLGAILAFEVARRFEQAGVVPLALFASGRPAPSHPRRGTVHRGTDEELIAELNSLGGTELAVLGDDDMRELVLPSVRSDYKAAETYHYTPGPALSCPVHAFVGDADRMASTEEVRGWAEHTSGGFTLDTFPGGHFYLVPEQESVLHAIADHLR